MRGAGCSCTSSCSLTQDVAQASQGLWRRGWNTLPIAGKSLATATGNVTVAVRGLTRNGRQVSAERNVLRTFNLCTPGAALVGLEQAHVCEAPAAVMVQTLQARGVLRAHHSAGRGLAFALRNPQTLQQTADSTVQAWEKPSE